MGNQNQLATLPSNYFDARLEELQKILPANTITGEALARVVLTAINKNSKLRECSQDSILGCLLDLASIGLMPNTPHQHAWLIPYWNSDLRVLQAQLQIGYKGFCELAYRSSEVKMIKGDVVRDGDEFDYMKGSNVPGGEFVRHKKSLSRGRKDKPILAAWNSVEMLSGGFSIEVMEAEELDKIRKMAAARQKDNKESPAWRFFEDEMYKKTVVKRNLKLLQVGSMDTVQRAIEIDNKVAGGLLTPESSPFAALPSHEHNITFEDPEPVEQKEVNEDGVKPW